LFAPVNSPNDVAIIEEAFYDVASTCIADKPPCPPSFYPTPCIQARGAGELMHAHDETQLTFAATGMV
jgi:hypothetical protein